MTKVTWRTLRERVRETRNALENSGVGAGDTVAAVMSNSVDTIVICLAALSLGAMWSSSSPDLGPAAIVDRYMQINPKIVFADDGYLHRGKRVSLADRISQWSQPISQAAKSLRDIVVVPFCKLDIDTSKIRRGCSWDSFINRTSGQKLTFDLQPFSHPAFAMFSSGTVSLAICCLSSGTRACGKAGAFMSCLTQSRTDWQGKMHHSLHRSRYIYSWAMTQKMLIPWRLGRSIEGED